MAQTHNNDNMTASKHLLGGGGAEGYQMLALEASVNQCEMFLFFNDKS